MVKEIMRVFCVFFHPDPSVSAVGGAERRFIEILKILEKERPQIKMTTIEPKPSLLTRFGVHCKTHLLSSPTSTFGSGWLGTYIEWVLWIFKTCIRCLYILRDGKYDMILTPNNSVPNLIPASFVHYVFRLPLCVVVHHIDLHPHDANPNFFTVYHMYHQIGFGRLTSFLKALAFFVILTVLRHSDTCIAVSNSTAKALVMNGVPEKRIYVNGNGVNQNYIDKFKPRGNSSYDSVFVGRISREKGVFDLMDAWRKIVQKRADARLLVIGSGLDINKVRSAARERGLERNVVIKGRCSDEEMYALMKVSKVFVFPSMLEGWGLAVAEALACGLPVVCYDIPALREIFGECHSVFLVPTGDIETLAVTILKTLKMNEKGALTEASRKYVKRFNWRKVALKDSQIMRECMLRSPVRH